MQFSYNWLQDFFTDPLPSAEDVAEQLGLHSFELEGLERLENSNYLIDWDVLPNRSSDCLCYEGIAREISAVFDIPMNSYLQKVENSTHTQDISVHDKLNFTLETDLVLRATKRYAENIKVKDSPKWLREKLESIGQKSVNNVVDITNYVMWMTGQPMHAFDYDKLATGMDGRKTMHIRHAFSGERVTDLTGIEHTLDESMLVVADKEKALDVAGIKGGIDSGVSKETNRIIFSACNFDYKNIRQTSRKLKLMTDASKRYENEVPWSKAGRAMELVEFLVTSECEGFVSKDFIDTKPTPDDTPSISLSVSQVNSLLGLSLTGNEIAGILKRLNQWGGQSIEENFVVCPNEDRPDLQIPEDIIEEIGRIYGLYNIPETPIAEGFEIPRKNKIKQSWYLAGDVLAYLGFYEAYNRSLVKGGSVALANSLNANADSLRSSLLPLLREKTERNLKHTETPHLFEIGKVFTGVSDGLVDERWSFAGVLGRRKIKEKQKKDLFLTTKGALETVFDALHVRPVIWRESNNGEAIAELEIDGEVIGTVGINWWELNFEKLVGAIDTNVEYRKPSKYPKMERDIAVFVPSTTYVADVVERIESLSLQHCQQIELFDIYHDEEQSRKSFAFRLEFQSYEKTLIDEVVNAEMDRVYQMLQSKAGFEVR